mgnify:CR=1 FL=1
MRPSEVSSSGNLLLSRLASDDLEIIRSSLSQVPLRDGQLLIEAQAPIDTLWFPEAGVVSLHEVMEDGTRVGIGIVGFEGPYRVVGAPGFPALLA